VTSKEPTADFADFADEGDAAQGSRWRGEVAWTGQCHAWPPFSLALSYPCHPCHPRSSQPQEIRDLVEQVPTQSLVPPRTQNFLGRDVPAPTRSINYFGVGDVPSPNLPRLRNPKLPGTRRPSPHPDPQLRRGRRRDVSTRDNTKRRNGGALQADGLDSSAGKDPQRHKGHCAPCQQGLGSLSRNVGTSSRSPGKFPPIEGIEERE